MTDFYVDPTATGGNTGLDPANAWTSVQNAIDGLNGSAPAAGDNVLCRGTELVTAETNYNAGGGSETAYVNWFGVNASWVNDGTPYTIDAQGNSVNVLRVGTPRYVSMCNFVLRDGNDGLTANGYVDARGWRFIGCDFVDNSNRGAYSGSAGLNGTMFLECRFNNNGDSGAYLGACKHYYCEFSGNGDAGWRLLGTNRGDSAFGCLFQGNTGRGVQESGSGSSVEACALTGCVIDGNGNAGILNNGAAGMVVNWCRITANGTYGIDANKQVLVLNTYMPAPGQPRANSWNNLNGSALDFHNNILNGTDADGGYVDPAGGDFALADSATLRNALVGWGDTSQYSSAGLTPDAAGGGGGGDPPRMPIRRPIQGRAI